MRLLLPLLLLSVFARGQNVNIPDANFKAYLVGNSSINTNGDQEIQVSEASSYTSGINCNGLNISDLTGIEAFTSIDILNCGGNNLSELDVSQNTLLDQLYCGGNNLTTLDVSQNAFIRNVQCQGNNITSLNVSNSSLHTLYCGNNQLTSIDLFSTPNLTWFQCESNNLTALNLSMNPLLIEVGCFNNSLDCLNIKNGNNSSLTFFYATSNPNLNCIEVDDANWSTTNWTTTLFGFDAQTSFSTDCSNNCSWGLGVEELNTEKELIKVVDLLGREVQPEPNKVLIYIYSDGTSEKVFKVE